VETAFRRSDLRRACRCGTIEIERFGISRAVQGFTDVKTEDQRVAFLRNVCRCPGERGDLPISGLEHAAADPDPLVAEHAVWRSGARFRKRCTHASASRLLNPDEAFVHLTVDVVNACWLAQKK